MKKNKKIIILWHSGGRMANQLWMAISVYAYCLECGFKFENHSFFEYACYFYFKSGNRLIDWLFFRPYPTLKRILPKSFFANQHDYFFRTYYKIYVKLIELFCRKKIIYAPDGDNPIIHRLKPAGNTDKSIDDFEKNGSSKMYLHGWLFRNLEGAKKYHERIAKYFEPRREIISAVDNFIDNLKADFKIVIGVHIRQGDYRKLFREGYLYFNEDEVAKILADYLNAYGVRKEDTAFVLCSDGRLDMDKFSSFNVFRLAGGGAVEDLFLLAKTDFILGSDSTFGAFASYFGNVPMAVFQREGIDWEYYRDKKGFFENKYLTTLNF